MTSRRSPRAARGGWVGAVGVAVGLLLASTSPAWAQADPYGPQQYTLERIGATTAWDLADGAGEVVAIVDSGVDLAHPDLADRFVRDEDGRVLGRDFVDDDDEPQDELGHGTMVAGIAVATRDNGVGIAGVAPGASLLPVRVLDADGTGTASQVDAGIRWAVDNGATVINLSLESAVSGNGDDDTAGVTAPVEAVRYAADNGVVVVAAAGNGGNAFTDYPADSPIVLVGATDREDTRAGFSDGGRDDLLMAPGVDVVSTWCRADGEPRCRDDAHTYGIADGTSFAAPHVTGALALLRSAGYDGREAVQRLRATARDLGPVGRDQQTGFGLIDVMAALGDVTPAPPPTAAPTGPPTSAPTEPVAPPATEPPPTSAPTDAPSGPATPEATTPAPPSPAPEPVPTASATPDEAVRGAWSLVALVLTAATAVAVGRAAVREL